MGRQSRLKKAEEVVSPKELKKKQENRRWTTIYIAIALAAVLLLTGVGLYRSFLTRQTLAVKDTVTIETTKGTIVMELYPKAAPITVANFESLANSGFYNGLKWHRVEDWVAQTGDPNGDGSGGSGTTIKLEIFKGLSHTRGAVGMARSMYVEDSASSQFYIVKKDATGIDGSYALFGRVVKGMEVVDQLTTDDTMTSVTVTPAAK